MGERARSASRGEGRRPEDQEAANKVFTLNEKTRLVRGGKPVKAADLSTERREIAVVVDHDVPGDIAIEIRFEAVRY